MKKLTKEDVEEMVNYQMEINGYKERVGDLKLIPDWFNTFTTTEAKQEEWREYLREKLKSFKIPRNRIENEIGWFIIQYGLRVTFLKDGK